MSNEVAVRSNTAMAIPDDIAAMFGQSGITLEQPHEKVNSLRYPGKVWQLTVDGATTEITMNVNGEKVPAQIVDVILLNIGDPRKRNRALFAPYEEGTNKGPLCWSDDSLAPSPDVKEPFSVACKGCPKSVKGSGKPDDNGNETVACKYGKVVCVIPSSKPSFKALELRMKVTSLWQPPENAVIDEKDGWRSLDSYIKHLTDNKVPYAAVVTSMKFASTDNYPRILFKGESTDENGVKTFKFISKETAAVIVPRINSDEVLNIIGTKHKGDGGAEPVVEHQAPKLAPPAAAKPVEVVQEVVQETEEFTEPEQPAKVEQPKVEKPKATKPKPVQVVETESLEDALSLAWD